MPIRGSGRKVFEAFLNKALNDFFDGFAELISQALPLVLLMGTTEALYLIDDGVNAGKGADCVRSSNVLIFSEFTDTCVDFRERKLTLDPIMLVLL